ncbi:MAG: Bacterial type II secretion system protein F domain protein [Lentisphaerae bacterium ADurb.Bin242]|nr:MAG: Bacterial type II secretion system protein F domain protein [Lentisphaerae bacterium ADurb.Bin242]
MNFTILAALCAGIAVAMATLVIVDFFVLLSTRYREKYLQETAVEMDDVLLSMPPARVLDLSLAVAAFTGFAAVLGVGFYSTEMSVAKTVIVALIGAVAAFPMPRIYLRWLKKQRLAKFNVQLEDALLSMSGSLKAGFSINQALEVVAHENRKPISFEFSLLIQELRLGVTLDNALDKMSARLNCPDFELVAVSILTARQTGGELTATLERLAGVIRERVRITGRIHALTAQGRMQALIIGLMPIALFIAMMNIAPDMMNAFFSTVVGILCLLAVIVLDVTGFLVIRKITNIDI